MIINKKNLESGEYEIVDYTDDFVLVYKNDVGKTYMYSTTDYNQDNDMITITEIEIELIDVDGNIILDSKLLVDRLRANMINLDYLIDKHVLIIKKI